LGQPAVGANEGQTPRFPKNAPLASCRTGARGTAPGRARAGLCLHPAEASPRDRHVTGAAGQLPCAKEKVLGEYVIYIELRACQGPSEQLPKKINGPVES
jgi:hypothetical protein